MRRRQRAQSAARVLASEIRPGRIDVEIELGNATAAQVQGLLLRFYPEAGERAAMLLADYPPQALSPAQVQQILIAAQSLDQAEAALGKAFQVAAEKAGLYNATAATPSVSSPAPPAAATTASAGAVASQGRVVGVGNG